MNTRSRLAPSALLPSRLIGRAPLPMAPRAAQPTYALGNPGQPSTVPTLLVADFDNSGSMMGPAGSDPLSNRFAEVAYAFRLVARKGTRAELGAVLHFDVPTSGDVDPVPLTRAGFPQLEAGLHMPTDGAGSSRLGPSLTRATELAAAYPTHQTTLVVLSDFLLLDDDPAVVLARLARFPGIVHAVVLGGRRDALVPSGVTTITHVQWNDAPGAVAKAVFGSLTRYRPGSRAHAAAEHAALPIPQRKSRANDRVRKQHP